MNERLTTLSYCRHLGVKFGGNDILLTSIQSLAPLSGLVHWGTNDVLSFLTAEES